MEQLTTLDELRRQIGVLACIDETEAPFVSCYLNLEQGEAGYRKALEDRASFLRVALDGDARADFEAAMGRIEAYLAAKLRPGAKGVALFAREFRAGAIFFLMRFAVPVPDWICV